MELENVEFVNGEIRMYFNDTVHQEGVIVEINAEDFFNKIASAFAIEEPKARRAFGRNK